MKPGVTIARILTLLGRPASSLAVEISPKRDGYSFSTAHFSPDGKRIVAATGTILMRGWLRHTGLLKYGIQSKGHL